MYDAGMKPCAFASVSAAVAFVLVTSQGCGGSHGAPSSPETAQTQGAESTTTPSESPSDSSEAPASSASPKAAPSSSAAADEDSGPETRTMDVIAGVIKAHRQEARACYEKALKKNPGLKGDLVIHFVLSPEGKVKSSEVNMERSTITNEMTAKCVMDVIRSLPFPESSKGMESKVNYPFNFNP